MISPSDRRAHVVGLGLIGGSVALALAGAGWTVSGEDLESESVERARTLQVIAPGQIDADVDLVVVATPSHVVARVATDILREHPRDDLIVTDVAGVKSPISTAISDPRFIGGHPMAGSELRGLEGARADLFRGCTWVLTPTAHTAPDAYSRLHSILRGLEANVMALDAATHDRLVAMASHVPHLVAGALMNEAAQLAESDGALLQLAAGGFRDMTRVAAGDPAIWPDLLIENRAAVTAHLARLRERLAALEAIIGTGDRSRLTDELSTAAVGRRALPGRGVRAESLVRLRVPVPDRPGVLAQVTTTASDLNVNIYDIEIAHSVEGQPGVLLLAVTTDHVDALAAALAQHGYHVARDETP
jgi:prephenate dehydrogenase